MHGRYNKAMSFDQFTSNYQTDGMQAKVVFRLAQIVTNFAKIQI